MRLLLDTSALFWWLIDEAQLSTQAHSAIRSKDNDVYVSVASAWEMAIKVGLGKWPEAQVLLNDFEGLARAESSGCFRSPWRTHVMPGSCEPVTAIPSTDYWPRNPCWSR